MLQPKSESCFEFDAKSPAGRHTRGQVFAGKNQLLTLPRDLDQAFLPHLSPRDGVRLSCCCRALRQWFRDQLPSGSMQHLTPAHLAASLPSMVQLRAAVPSASMAEAKVRSGSKPKISHSSSLQVLLPLEGEFCMDASEMLPSPSGQLVAITYMQGTYDEFPLLDIEGDRLPSNLEYAVGIFSISSGQQISLIRTGSRPAHARHMQWSPCSKRLSIMRTAHFHQPEFSSLAADQRSDHDLDHPAAFIHDAFTGSQLHATQQAEALQPFPVWFAHSHLGCRATVQWHPEGQSLVVVRKEDGQAYGTLAVDVKADRVTARGKLFGCGGPLSVAWHPCRNAIALGASMGTLRDTLQTGSSSVGLSVLPELCDCPTFSPDGKLILAMILQRDGPMCLLRCKPTADRLSFAALQTLPMLYNAPFSPDSTFLIGQHISLLRSNSAISIGRPEMQALIYHSLWASDCKSSQCCAGQPALASLLLCKRVTSLLWTVAQGRWLVVVSYAVMRMILSSGGMSAAVGPLQISI